MTILPSCPMYKHSKCGEKIFIKNNKEFLKHTIEESLVSITKDYTKKKIKSNSNQLRIFLNNSLKYFKNIKYTLIINNTH